MKFPFKIVRNKEVREQGALIPLGDTSKTGNYISNIIKKKFYDYYDINHRVAVCKLDSKASRLTYKWAQRCVAKTFKFYSSHEVDGVEVMKEQRARWNELNANEILKKCITPMVRDGFVLLELIKEKDSLNYNVFGEYESKPILWTRDIDNKIVEYKIQYTPQPRGVGSSTAAMRILATASSTENLRAINRILKPKELIHVEYGEPNSGCGTPLIETAWDPLIKLCGESHQQMLDRRSIPTLHLTEDEQDSENTAAKGLLKMVANSDQDTARVWYHKNIPSKPGEYSEYPRFAYESPTSTPEYPTRHQAKTVGSGDYGNLSDEWANLCTLTGHTIHYFIGNRAGAVVGSETDQWDDIQQEITDFALFEPLIRKILDWLAANDLITMPTEPFVIKYWRDWESIERKAKVKEEMALMKTPQNPNQPGNQIEADQQDNKELQDKRNELVVTELLNCIKRNMSFPMTAVMSSWIARVGYSDETDRLYMQLLTGVVYSKPAPMGEWSYLDWAESGSKGGYFWDYLSQRDPPWERDTIPTDLVEFGTFTGTPEEMAEYKISLVGTTREPFSIEMLQRLYPGIDWQTEWEQNKEFFKSLKEAYEEMLEKPTDKTFQKLISDYLRRRTHNKQNYEFVKIPMLDYPLIDTLDTETKIKRLGQKHNWSMGTSTATNIKNMLGSLKQNANKHQFRINTLTAEAFGNSIKEGHPLLYDIGNGVIVEEYICPDAWKKNVGRTIPLGVYHSKEDLESPNLPDWQIIGTAEVFGWDDESGEDYVKFNYDYAKIEYIFQKLNEYDWLTPILKENGTSDISTAYFCDIEYRWSDKLNKMIRVQTNIDLKSIVFVPKGNCPGDICSVKVVAYNSSAMQEYIKKCIHEGIPKEQCIAKAYAKFKK